MLLFSNWLCFIVAIYLLFSGYLMELVSPMVTTVATIARLKVGHTC